MSTREIGLTVRFQSRDKILGYAIRALPRDWQQHQTELGVTSLGRLISIALAGTARDIKLFINDGSFTLLSIKSDELTSREIALTHTEAFREQLWDPYIDIDDDFEP